MVLSSHVYTVYGLSEQQRVSLLHVTMSLCLCVHCIFMPWCACSASEVYGSVFVCVCVSVCVCVCVDCYSCSRMNQV